MTEIIIEPATSVVARASRDKWVLVAVCAAYPILTTGLFLVAFPLWVLPWTTEFHQSRATVMSVFVVSTMVTTFLSPVVGRMVDVLSPRVTTIAGAVIMAVGFGLVSVSQSFWQVGAAFATLIALGAAMAGLLPAQTVALRAFPEKAGTIGGLMILGLSLGGALLPLALAPALASFGWRVTFAMSAVVVLVLVTPLAWIFLDGKKGTAQHKQAGVHGSDAVAGAPSDSLMSSKAALANPAFWMILGGFFPVALVTSAIGPNVIAIAVDEGMSATSAAYLISVMGVAGAIGAPLVGWLADRIDPRIVYAGIAASLAAALVLIPAGSAFLVPAMVVIGLVNGGGMPLLAVLILRRFGPANFPRVQGLFLPFLVPAFTGPVFAGLIHDQTGSYAPAFLGLAVLMVASIAPISRVKAVQVSTPTTAPALGV